MHATERNRRILELMADTGFVSFRQLEQAIEASAATLRRDLKLLAKQGEIERVHGGARLLKSAPADRPGQALSGIPFHVNIHKNTDAKKAIGRAAAALCDPGEGVMIDGGSTTLQICPYIDGKDLQILTNSLHLVSALLPQKGTKVLVPSGAVFPEQNIILSPSGEDSMPRFSATKLFMGASAVGKDGPLQDDVLLVAAERRLIERADQVILLVDSSKFHKASGVVICQLSDIYIVITDKGIAPESARMIQDAGVDLIIADPIS